MGKKQQVFFYLLVFILLTGLKCTSINAVSNKEKEFKAIYMNQIKLTYFRQILKKGYNYSSAVQEILNTDHSGFTEQVITEEDYISIDSLTTLDNEKMKTDSIEGIYRAEGSQGKRQLEYIINKLNSGFLDSFARKRYKSYKHK